MAFRGMRLIAFANRLGLYDAAESRVRAVGTKARA